MTFGPIHTRCPVCNVKVEWMSWDRHFKDAPYPPPESASDIDWIVKRVVPDAYATEKFGPCGCERVVSA